MKEIRATCPSGICAPDQYPAHLLDIVAEISLVANIDGIALAAFDVLCDVLSADAG